jgi:hypothetical protein
MTGPGWLILPRLAAGVAVFALPGWLLSQRIESGARPIAAFLGSAVVLFQVVLLLALCGLPLHLGTVGGGVVLVSIVLAWAAPGAPRPASLVAGPATPAHEGGVADWCWWGPIAVGLASVAARALVDPLSGFDNVFRWDHLARLMIARESLGGYPPVTTNDFFLYGWCDGIPPLLPFLNFWLYASADSIAPALTSVRVVGEAVLLGWLVARFSRELWGRRAATIAAAALGCSALLLWSVAMGQETGLVTLSFVALLYFVFRYRSAPELAAVFWAALAAAVGGLTREYGLSFVLLGALLLWRQKAPARHLALFLTIAAGLTAPWYARNWVLTGNPLYPHSCGGLFPTNPVHAEFMEGIARQAGFATSPYSKVHLVEALGWSAGLLAALALAGLPRWRARSTVWGTGVALIVGLWLWSVPQTAGGWVYSTRMLAPAIALGAVLCGWIAQTGPRLRLGIALIMLAGSADAARRTWSLPIRPLGAVWPWDFSRWAETRKQMEALTEKAVWPVLVREAGTHSIVVEHPLHHPLVWASGGRPVPLVSPLLAPTLDPGQSWADVVRSLAAADIRFIVVGRSQSTVRELGVRHRFWRQLAEYPPTVNAGALSIYDLHALEAALTAQKM